MPKTQILLQPQAPLDMRPEQLQGLAEAIRALDPDYEVRIAYYDQGYGVTWWEVLGLWFSSTLGAAAINQIARVATDWLIDRKKNGPRNTDRPKVVRLVRYTGETGETIEKLEIQDLDTGVEHKPPDFTHPQPKPPIRDDEDPEKAFWIWEESEERVSTTPGSRNEGANKALWKVTAGAGVQWLYVELNGEYKGTWDEHQLRIIEAKPHDTLALFDSPGYGTNSKPQKGDLITIDEVRKLASPYKSN